MDTVKLIYKGSAPIWVADARILAEPGATYPIPADIAASLLARKDWAKAKAPKESEQ